MPRLWAILLLVFGLLPIANWFDGGHEAPWYGSVLSEWISGTAVAVGISALLFLLVARRTKLWPGAGFERLSASLVRHPWASASLLGLMGLILYAVISRTILAGRPLLIDEIVQVMQARIFAEGRLMGSLPAYPEFFSALHVVDLGRGVYSQFPPGGPLMLLPGVLLGAPWLTGPVFGAAAVTAWWGVVRRTEPRAGAALGAAVLLAFSPFMAFMAGSHMNHVPALAWLCVSLWSLQRLTSGDERIALALVCGLGFGMMASIRPVDGAAFAIPAGAWMLVRTLRGQMRPVSLMAAGLGVALPLAGVLAYNWSTTGSPLLFGYELLWGPSHGLGFHRAPWGVAHTPERGLELVSLYFLRLQTYLFEAPVPSLLPAAAALLMTRSMSAFDRYLLAGSGLLVLGYFAYWHDGFFLGPRFMYLLLPALSLWTARLPSIVAGRLPESWSAGRFVALVYLISALIAVSVSVPARVRQYAGGLTSMRMDFTQPAEVKGVRNSLILVRESWGSQLISRLWALGVSRSETEGVYRSMDTCELEGAVTQLEAEGVRGAAAFRRLAVLLGDSARLVESKFSPDRTEKVLPGGTYGATCQRRILEDRAGYTFLAPLLARDPGSNRYARDLHGRDTLLLTGNGGKPVWLLRASSSRVGAPLILEPVNMDSARAEWRSGDLP